MKTPNVDVHTTIEAAKNEFWNRLDQIKERELTYEEILEFVKQGLSLNEKAGEHGPTPCMYVAAYGFTDAVNALVKAGAYVNERDERGSTACIEAARRGYTNTVKALAKLGANLDAKNDYGQTACIAASHFGYTDTIKVLAGLGADIYAKDEEGKTALSYIEDEKTKQEIIEASEKYKQEHSQGLKETVKSSRVPKAEQVQTDYELTGKSVDRVITIGGKLGGNGGR